MLKDIKVRFKDKKFLIFSIICLIMIICPFFSLLKQDGQKLNYIYNDGQVADGVFVILFVILIFLFNLFKFSKTALLPLSLLVSLLGLLLFNLCHEDVLKYATFNFYLMYACLVGLISFNIMFIMKK